MAKLRTVALRGSSRSWSLSRLSVTGSLGPAYRRMVRYFPPEVWSALGTWFTAAVAIVTVLVAGRHAKQHVDEARHTREEQGSAKRGGVQRAECCG
jgi:hypothetical protein